MREGHDLKESIDQDDAGRTLGRCRYILNSGWTRAALIVLLLWGLHAAGRFNPTDLVNTEYQWRFLALALLLFVPNYVLAAFRLKVIIGALGAQVSLRQTWRWTMIGVMAELILPFIGGSDVARAAVASRRLGRSISTASVLLDRVVGLVSVVVLAAVAGLIAFDQIKDDRQLAQIPLMTALVLGAVLVSGLVCRLALLLGRKWWIRQIQRLPGGARLSRFAVNCLTILERPWHLAGAILIGVAGHVCWCLTAACAARGMGMPIDFSKALLVFPIVVLSNTLSIAGGIGGGTLAFEYVCEKLLGAAKGFGTQLGLLMPLLVMLSKLIGLPTYLSPPTIDDSSEINASGEANIFRADGEHETHRPTVQNHLNRQS